MKRHLFYAGLILLTLSGLADDLIAQKKPAGPKKITASAAPVKGSDSASVPRTTAQQRRQETFEKVWQTLNDNYFDKTFSGLDWNKIRIEYQPRVSAAKTDAELHEILQEMINRLDRSHFAIIPPEAYTAIAAAKKAARRREKLVAAGKPADEKNPADDSNDDWLLEDSLAKFGIGVDIRLLNDQFVVTHVDDGSAAAAAGLKTGYVIDKINGISLAETVKRIMLAYSNILSVRRHLPYEIVSWFLNGERDTSVSLTCLDEKDQPREFKIPRERLKGETITIGNNIPEQYLGFDVRTLPDNVGYIKFNVFALPIIDKFCSAISELKDKKAIVVDLRGNLGGVIGTIMAVSGMLTDRPLTIGTSIYRTGSEPFMTTSKAKNFKGKLVLLVDSQTISAAEIFAAAMQDSGRVLIVGDKTAGEALPSVSIQLQTGAYLMYPIANFKTAKGNLLEGVGVQPDFVTVLDRKQLLQGIDSQLEKALALIKEDTQFPKQAPLNGGSSSDSELPPPPKAAPKSVPPPVAAGLQPVKKGQLAAVTAKAVPSSTPEPPSVKDEKSLRVISGFLTAIGGEEAFKRVKSFSLSGVSQIGVKGSTNEFAFHEYRQGPDKLAIILSSPAVGEIREVYNGKKGFVQTDLGIDQNAPDGIDPAKRELFSAIDLLRNAAEFKSLKYLGTFDQDGRKYHLVDAKMSDDYAVILKFDVETKMLASFTSEYSTMSLGDYRKVGDIILPFFIDAGSAFRVKLIEIKLNQPLDETYFTRKEKCFDKPLPANTN